MKNITFSADAELIEQARALARSQRKTLNELFREWLLQVTSRATKVHEYKALKKELRHVESGRKFTRDEMHER